MANVLVERFKRRLKIADKNSPMKLFLRQKPKTAKTYQIEDLAKEIEMAGSLSAEDVTHVMRSFVRAMRTVLTSGNKVKVDGLGLFFTTFRCKGVDKEDDCSIKNITRVNFRFKVDNTLRLVNDSLASTRGGDNNMVFELEALAKKGADKPKPDSGSDKPKPEVPNPLE